MAQGFSVTYSVVDNATAQINAINKRIQQLRAPMDAQAKAMAKFVDVSGLKNVAQGFESIAKSALSAGRAITSVASGLGVITGAATLAGLAKMVSGFASLGEELTKTGMLLGETPERLYGIGQAMRFFGGNAQTAIDALVNLKNAQYDATLGMNAMAAGLAAKLGVPLMNSNKQFRDVVDVQHDLFAAFDKLPNQMDRVRAATVMGGKSMAEYYQQYQFFVQSGGTLDQWTAKQRDMATLNKEQIKAYNDMELALGPLNASFYDLGATVSATVAPAVTALLNDLNDYIKSHKGELTAEIDAWRKSLEDWVKSGGPQHVIDDLGKIAAAAEKVMKVGEWFAAHPALAGALLGGAVGARFGGLPGALVGGAAGAVAGYKMGESDVDQAWNDYIQHTPLNKAMNKDEFVKQWNATHPGGAAGPPAAGPEAPAAPVAPAAPGLPAGVAPGQPYGAAPIPPAGGLIAPGALNPTVGVQGAAAPGNAPAAFGRAIEQVESSGGTNYNNEPLKGHSATGPRQMMPSTFNEFARPGERIDNPEDNRRVSDRYINYLWNKYGGDPAKVAYAYANGSLVSPDRNPGYVKKLLAAYNPTAPTPDSAPKPGNTPGGGAAGNVVDQMVALAGTRGAAVRQFLRDPHGVVKRDPDLGLWCAEFTNAYLQHVGVKGTGSLMAASFRTWGQEVAKDQLAKGDVLLNQNLKHVGVATGRTWLNTPGHRPGEVEEVSSNMIGPGGQLLNLPGTRWRSDVDVRRSPELAMAEARPSGAPGTLMAGGAMPNGSVNVDVTHKNAPSNVEVAAYATGGGINLTAPRVEFQHMGQI